jgi:hypothetical protein
MRLSMIAAAVTVCLTASSAPADESGAPVAVVAGPRGALAARLSDELRAAGLHARVDASAATDRDGVVIVVGEGPNPTLEIWSVAAGESMLVATIDREAALDTRVLRAVELVRALALDARPAPRAGPDPSEGAAFVGRERSVSSAPAVDSRPPTMPSFIVSAPAPRPDATQLPYVVPPLEPDRSMIFDLGIAPTLGLGAQGASFALAATARLWLHEFVGAGVMVEVPVVGAVIANDKGKATMRRTLVGAELTTAPVVRTGAFGLVLSPGVGLAHVSFAAEADAPYRAPGDDAFAFHIYGRAEARLRIFDRFHATAGALGGAALPRIEVRFAGREVSTVCATGALSLGTMMEL